MALRRLIIGIVVLVVLLVGAAFAVPLFIPTETVRSELIARIEQATGRQARIDGPISISLIPTVHVSAGGIGLSGVAGSGEALKVGSVSFGVSLLPLISGRVAINSVTIVKPELVYEIDQSGRSNWQAAAAPAAQTAAGAQPKSMEDLIASSEAEQTATQETLATLDRIGIGKLTISDGTLTYRDRRNGRVETVTAMNLTLAAPELARGASLDGSFTWDGKQETVALKLGARPDPTKLAALPVDLTLSDDLATITAKGTALDGDTLFGGTVTAKGGSLANLAGRFGASLPAAPAYGAFDLSATFTATSARTTLDHFAVTLGGVAFDGQAVIATDRPRPGIGLRLAAGSIDADAFVAPAGAGGGGKSGGGKGGAAAETPIDLSALGAVDANVSFTAQAVKVGSVALEGLGLDAKLVDGTLQATISKVTVNGAPGSGNLTVAAKGGTPQISGAVKMTGLDVAGVLALAGVSTPVAGRGSVDVAFKTSGATTSALAANLDGSGSLSLADGKVTGLNLADQVGGDKTANEIDAIDIAAAFKSLNSPISAKGAFTWRKVRFDVTANADVRALLDGKTTKVALQAQSKTVDLGFDGEAGMGGLGKGEVSLATPSLRNLLAWIGRPIGSGGGLQNFAIKGAVALGKDTFTFDRAAFTLDKSSGLGTGSVTFGKRPSVSAGLSMKVLDVTPYVAASGAAGGGASGGGASSSGGSGGSGGWSTQPIAFDGLKAADANLNLKADEILANKIKIGATAMTVTLSGGKLAANLTDMSLYQGKGSGTLSIDGAASTPAVSASFQLSGLAAQPFLTDAIGFDKIEGTGAFSFDLSAAGTSQAALMKSLKGKGATELRDGAIRGFNLASLKGLSLQSVLGGQLGTTDRTDFSRLAGTYTIAGGVLTNNDLVLVGPLVRASGAGTVDIGNRTIAYRLEPKIVGTLQGQGASGDAKGLTLPFRIEGSWDNPRYVPEFDNLLANPNQAVDQLKTVGGGLLNSFFGGGNDKKAAGDGQAPAAQQQAAPPADAGAPQPITPQANQPQDGGTPSTDQQQPENPLQLLIPQLVPQKGQ